jgi:hypothetical protein
MPKRGRPFESGNKCGRGRPRGSRNKKNAAQQLLDENSVPLLRKALADSYKGDSAMLRMIVGYLLRIPKDQREKRRKEELPGEPGYRGVTSLTDEELERIARGGLTKPHEPS